MTNSQLVKIYTDGACSGNPGIGGWGAIILVDDKKPIYLKGGSQDTTNNKMELTAAIKAIKYFKKKIIINIYTDSKYLKDGITIWIKKWKLNGWKTSNKKKVKNSDLWKLLEEKIHNHEIHWTWVKGHDENILNEKADMLAKKAIES